MDQADFRSDTVTRPGEAMRAAMAAAEVGDDVLGDDPSVKRLETEVAGLTGFPAALFMPSGTMGNQVAVHVHCAPGDEAIADPLSHTFNYEAGGVARFSGVQVRPVEAPDGQPGIPALAAALRDPDDEHEPLSTLLVVENTHNLRGGRVVPVARWDTLTAWTRERGLKLHLDGARLWNAAVAAEVEPARLIRGADSAMLCLSKGLGAPVGSVLVGPEAFIHRCRRVRKAFGGGMRQSGILAAAGLLALEGWRERLLADHRRARELVEGIAGLPGITVELESVETNLVYIALSDEEAARALVVALEEKGVLALSLGARIRMVTHMDLRDDHVARAIDAFRVLLS